MCPYCRKSEFRKKGYFKKSSTRAERIQRYYCRVCERSFSTQTGRLSYREKKPHENQRIYRLLCSGVSQTRIAVILDLHRKTVASKISKLARFARRDHHLWILSQPPGSCRELQFDEMESFEHTKCKPITISIAVNRHSREILGLFSGPIPAKGHLAKISRKKYGKRANHHPDVMRRLMERAVTTYGTLPKVVSDKKSTYPNYVSRYLAAKHVTTKGRRGCVVGQGELKKIGFDRLFHLNHTCGMVRDNLKTMSRKTWCTSKRIGTLQDLLDLYLHFHNRFVSRGIQRPSVCGDPIN